MHLISIPRKAFASILLSICVLLWVLVFRPQSATQALVKLSDPIAQASAEVNTQPGSIVNELSFMRAEHIQIRVPDFEETVSWYQEKLGFREQIRWTVEALPEIQLAYLELNGFRIEVIGGGEFESGRPAPSNFQEALDIRGYGHFCFEVGNVDAALLELERRGVPTFVSAATYPLSNTWRRVGFILDNNGNVIEFAEPLSLIERSNT